MKNTKRIVLSALFIGLGIVLPFVTGGIPKIGNMLLPMHLPVLLCGLICGPIYGGLVGAITPLLRGFTLGMPPIMPIGVPMAFELCAYGLSIGLIYKSFKKKNTITTLISLISAMIIGRLVWGIVQFVILGINNSVFTFNAFITSAFLNAVPGIIFQIVFIPLLMGILRKARLVK